jgi:serine protease AprX
MTIHFTSQGKKRVNIITTLFLLLASLPVTGQTGSYSYFYRVYFRDKGANFTARYTPEDILSQRALNRREKAGIEIDYKDYPVCSEYLGQLSALGFKLHSVSKWMNTALFKTRVAGDDGAIRSLPFVAEVKLVRQPAGKSAFNDKLEFQVSQADLPPYDRPVTMLNGYPLHYSGFDGKNILIAVLDGGFINADLISSLSKLRARKGIKATYDFVTKSPFVYSYHSHGTAVLSILAGQIPGIIQGSAPGADYLLIRTEDTSSEFPVEEDYWAAGAEYADSAGADIISSSLGYFNFDDPSLNYKFSDLDGNTTFVTRAADAAASRGILVINSAGNERNNAWIRIIAPSDGDSVVAVGAVDGDGIISSFSSAGPSADGRIKPDNSAMGVSVTLQTSISGIARGNGTSFSCPVLSGMTACLMQAVPEATAGEIINALHSSADRYLNPDSLYGYGIPDFVKTLLKLQDLYLIVPDNKSIARPNPTTGEFEIVFREAPGKLRIDAFTSSGINILSKDFGEFAGRSLMVPYLLNRPQGIYLFRLTSTTGTYTLRIIKLNGR